MYLFWSTVAFHQKGFCIRWKSFEHRNKEWLPVCGEGIRKVLSGTSLLSSAGLSPLIVALNMTEDIGFNFSAKKRYGGTYQLLLVAPWPRFSQGTRVDVNGEAIWGIWAAAEGCHMSTTVVVCYTSNTLPFTPLSRSWGKRSLSPTPNTEKDLTIRIGYKVRLPGQMHPKTWEFWSGSWWCHKAANSCHKTTKNLKPGWSPAKEEVQREEGICWREIFTNPK